MSHVVYHNSIYPPHAGPQDPVLINDKLARGFAKAWSVGSEQQEVRG